VAGEKRRGKSEEKKTRKEIKVRGRKEMESRKKNKDREKGKPENPAQTNKNEQHISLHRKPRK
jgi:hypothetical protein